ncbi:hypothetical protein [Maritalea sp.]|uniref:hypothetical protein n=1 Tax=Maritalea sp. TaxID=2003361 RepID=UPI003EF8A8B7
MQNTKSRGANGLKTILLAGVATLALGANVTLAQDSNTSTPTTKSETLTSSAVKFSLDVGAIDVVESNVDAETIRSIISGELVENAQALAGLTAKSIFIPEIKVTYNVEVDGEATDSVFTFKNIALTNVKNGIAQTASMETIDGTIKPPKGSLDAELISDMDDDKVKFSFGQSTITQFNLGALLNAYGLITPSSNEMVRVYQDYIVAGGTLDAGPLHCDIGKYQSGEYRARAMKVSYPELMVLATEMETNDNPSPDQIVKFLDFYADMLYAFESSPVTFDGLTCAGEKDGTAVDIKMGETVMGAMGNGVYPEISISDLEVKVSGEDNVDFKLGNFTVKQIDFAPTVAAYRAIEDISALDKDWFEENFRTFIPAFDGFSMSGFFADVPDGDSGEQVVVEIENFDVSLHNYVNGIPADISLSAAGLKVDLPKNSGEKSVKQLRDLGLERINVGYDVTLNWDEATQVINVARLMFTGEKLGTVDVSGQLVGASKELFATDPQMAMIAALGLGIKELDMNLDNQGFLDIALAQAAAEQGAPVDAFQTQISALAKGMIVGLLGGVDQAVDLGDAVSGFLSGDAKKVNIKVTSKSASGVGAPQVMALQSDPTKVLELVDIQSSAQ